MNRLRSVIRLDVLQQSRAKLYGAGVPVAVVFGLVLRFLVPEAYLPRLIPIFYITVLGGTTFMFGAAMLLVDKSTGTLQALRTSMITTWDYILSKAITLSLFALVESIIVYLIAAPGLARSPGWLGVGLLMLGGFYTFMGLGLAASHRSIQSFLFPVGALVAMVLQLPFLSVLELGPDAVWFLIPSRAPLLFMQAGFVPLSGGQWAYAIGIGVLSVVASAIFCYRRFAAHIAFPEA
ncbi:MAG: hypothetical protein B7733_01900 [Myxococcales bacterium FL481]|nr:MAG: hypothetical protein B7733_01900 [Myxococcales bacterium FL481]